VQTSAEARFIQINDAYKTLTDPKQKAQYDQILKGGQVTFDDRLLLQTFPCMGLHTRL
jgi:DnaJ-class molecular chaperone